MAVGPYKVTEDFEKAIAEYCGSPYAIALDSCSHALFLSLMWERKNSFVTNNTIFIPKKTFPSVPCEVMHAGFRLGFFDQDWKGIYRLWPTEVSVSRRLSQASAAFSAP